MRKVFLLLLAIIPLLCFSQELPPVLTFYPDTYGGANQNWMIAQDDNNYIYAANNEGLLEYNGANWRLYPSPNQTILRSVKAVGDKIYTGCYMDFGYWQRDSSGALQYTSLTSTIKDKLAKDEQFWNIITYRQWIVFQSLDQFFLHDTSNDSFDMITPNDKIVRSYKVDDAILFQSLDSGLYEIENGTYKLVTNDANILGKRIVDVFGKDRQTMVLTENDGIFTLEDGALVRNESLSEEILKMGAVYDALMLNNGDLAIGSISNGILVISQEDQKKYRIDQAKGLANNTVLSTFEDREHNIWLGLDNGINCINVSSPYRIFNDTQGALGTIYTTAQYQGKLFLGTNQGLFFKDQDKEAGLSAPFQFVEGTQGQVWSLFEYDETLFCGHNAGTFIIKNGKAELITKNQGTWKLSPVPTKENLLMQGTYNGLSLLKKENGKWQFSHTLEGFKYSSRYFEFLDPNHMFMNHEYKGVYELALNDDLTMVSSFKKLDHPPKYKNSSLTKYQGSILYGYEDGVYELNPDSKSFIKDPVLSIPYQQSVYHSGKLIVDQTDKLWLFTENALHYAITGKLSNDPILNEVSIPYDLRRTLHGYENILHLDGETFLLGGKHGYLTVSLDQRSSKEHNIAINSVAKSEIVGKPIELSIDSTGIFNNKENNISISYSIPNYDKYKVVKYQHKLSGHYDSWGEMHSQSNVKFENLPFGDYTFEVRGMVGETPTSNTATYNFTIKRPWFLSNIAMLLYVLALIAIGSVVHNIYRQHYKQQQYRLITENQKQLEIQQLEADQEIMKMKNEQLESTIESKNRELAASTMSLINKNEILAQIKGELTKKGDQSNNVSYVVRLIDKNINEEDNWNFFKEAFNNADKDFLQKIKSVHPQLTPNDLRLCAYLRLNLSSKEIAPLLNITSRSVEIKRYRLRKKMNLPHEKSLVEYILSI